MEKFVSPPKQRKLSQDGQSRGKCYVCKKEAKASDHYKVYLFNPSMVSLAKLIDCIKIRHGNGELEFSELYKEVKDLSAHDLLLRNVTYQKQCYASLTNKNLIERGKNRYGKGKMLSSVSIIVNKSTGRPNKQISTEEDELRTSRDVLFDKYLCLFCQERKKDTTFLRDDKYGISVFKYC